MATELSDEDKTFLAECEEEFKDRYTDKDEEFMIVFNAEPSVPPIVEKWWISNNSSRRFDRRHDKQFHPYQRDRYNNRDRGYQDRRYNNRNYTRGYNDYEYDDNNSRNRFQRH